MNLCNTINDSNITLERFGRDFLKPYCFKIDLIIKDRIEKIKIWEK